MEKRIKLENLVAGAGKTAKNILGNAVQAVDQNNDGKFDFKDVAEIAESMGSTVKENARTIKENAVEKARLFEMPKFIRVIERDKKRAEREVCQGSIGYESDYKGLHMLNIYKDSIEVFGLVLYPDSDSEYYYVDPSERDRYIALDEYFGYLKLCRVNELKKIAQDLGATHFKVTYKEEQTSYSVKKAKLQGKTAKTIAADTERKSSQQKFSAIDATAEMTFPGH